MGNGSLLSTAIRSGDALKRSFSTISSRFRSRLRRLPAASTSRDFFSRRGIGARSISLFRGLKAGVLLHFGAVDYAATVWVNGSLACEHQGGYTPFHADITDLLKSGGPAVIVVRAEDDPSDLSKPRGKQDWMLDPHSIWYFRTIGYLANSVAGNGPALVDWLCSVDAESRAVGNRSGSSPERTAG